MMLSRPGEAGGGLFCLSGSCCPKCGGHSFVKVCTWVGCKEAVWQTMKDKDSRPWAYLCQQHHAELDEAMSSGDAKRIMGAWVKAQGGAEKATEMMRPAIDAGANLIRALQTGR